MTTYMLTLTPSLYTYICTHIYTYNIYIYMHMAHCIIHVHICMQYTQLHVCIYINVFINHLNLILESYFINIGVCYATTVEMVLEPFCWCHPFLCETNEDIDEEGMEVTCFPVSRSSWTRIWTKVFLLISGFSALQHDDLRNGILNLSLRGMMEFLGSWTNGLPQISGEE